MRCVELTADVSDGHLYRQYEVVESHSVWMEDTSVVCWEGVHLVSAIAAGMGLCVCLGVIGFTVAILFIGKSSRRLRNPRFIYNYGFLYLTYKRDGVALYWESVITVMRMVLAGIRVYADHRETSNVLIGFLAFVIFVFVALHMIVEPFDQEDSSTVFPSYCGSLFRSIGAEHLASRWVTFNQYVTLNGMEGASLFVSLSLFLAATCINDNRSKKAEIDVLLTICFAVNSVFVMFMLHRLYYGVHHYLDVIAKERKIAFREDALPGEDSKRGIPKKLWIVLTTKRVDAEERSAGGGDIAQRPLLEKTTQEEGASVEGGGNVQRRLRGETTEEEGSAGGGDIAQRPLLEKTTQEEGASVEGGGNEQQPLLEDTTQEAGASVEGRSAEQKPKTEEISVKKDADDGNVAAQPPIVEEIREEGDADDGNV